MPDTNNSFLASLFAAMENNNATDAVLDKGPKDGKIEGILDDQNDPSGNSGSPGDDGNPVAKDDPDAGKLEGDPASVTKSDDPSGNPGSPGDEKGTPATEIFGRASRPNRNRASNLSINQLVTEFIKVFGSNEVVTSSKEELMKAIEEDGLNANEYRIVKCGAGYAAIVDDEANTKYVMVGIKDKTMLRLISAARMRKYLAKYYDKEAKNPPAAASEADDGVDFSELVRNISIHGGKTEKELEPAKDGHKEDPEGPGVNGTAVSPGSGSKPAPEDTVAKNANCPSGNPDGPGVNGTPVSKSGDSQPLPKTEAEKVADDKSGNPPSPGVNGTPAPGLDSFIAACEQLMIEPKRGIVNIPDGMSLESYAMQLGLAEIASRALEADLTAAERRALPDSEFGLPAQRKWPLNDESHVRSAIQNFHWCPKEDQRELAKNILKAMKRFGMKDVEVSEGNPFLKYYPEAKIVPRKKAAKKAE